jgi:periplasmic protein TonB
MDRLAALVLAVACFACDQVKGSAGLASERRRPNGRAPDSLPVMLNTELPFRYPQALYAQHVQGNVTLRLFIDSLGSVYPDSTVVEQSSGYPELDSAAVTGAQRLHFRPAMEGGSRIAVSVLFPVYFRHPDATPLPGDTILKRH